MKFGRRLAYKDPDEDNFPPQGRDSYTNNSSGRHRDFELNKQAAFWLKDFWNPKLNALYRWREGLDVIQPGEEFLHMIFEDKLRANNSWFEAILYNCDHQVFKRQVNIVFTYMGVFL